MNTNSLTAIAFLAAIAAIAIVPMSAAAACIALTVTGLLSTMVADYGRAKRPSLVLAPVVTFTPRNEAVVDEAA
jgi:hypothetical protein